MTKTKRVAVWRRDWLSVRENEQEGERERDGETYVLEMRAVVLPSAWVLLRRHVVAVVDQPSQFFNQSVPFCW